jgi:MarR family transcriptional regulator, lower aerobic nicotinate degradation pathway regulator
MGSFTTKTPLRVPEELAASSGFLLARLGLAFKSTAIHRIEQEGFEANQYGILAILGEGARETQATIADALALDPSRLVALLDSLEERGLVARQRHTHDRRRHVVSITPAGKRQLQRLRTIARQIEDEFFASLDAQDRKTFHRLLLQLAGARDPRCDFAPPVSRR